MSSKLRPSPALILATLALVVALGGTAYAVTKIDGSALVDHSVSGRKMINDTLTGTQIKESSLGKVPHAGDAGTVSGLTVRKVFYAPASTSGSATKLFSLGGLTVKGACVAGPMVQILASTAFTHAHLTSVMWNSAGGGGADGLHVPDFSAQTVDLTDSNDWGETTFTYTRSGGVVVSGELSFEDSGNINGNIFNHTRACLISGFVTSSAPK